MCHGYVEAYVSNCTKVGLGKKSVNQYALTFLTRFPFLRLSKNPLPMQQVIRLSLTDVLDETEAVLDASSPVLFVSSHSRQEKFIFTVC